MKSAEWWLKEIRREAWSDKHIMHVLTDVQVDCVREVAGLATEGCPDCMNKISVIKSGLQSAEGRHRQQPLTDDLPPICTQ